MEALCQRDTTGGQWLGGLLDLARRTGSPAPLTIPQHVGHLIAPPQFEYAVDPPRSWLRWLIEHPDRLVRPPETVWTKWSQETQAKREALLAGDAAARAEALTELDLRTPLPQRAWWRLEGVTRVDCALLTAATAVFIEGKRTEIGPSKRITWYPQRNQILRLLDCAAALARQTGRRHSFVMLVVEQDIAPDDAVRQSEVALITHPQTARASLPHLTQEEQTELLRHYPGTTTWQDIVKRFGLGRAVLIDQVDC